MDIARQLEQKHPQLFEPLIFSFQESRPNTVFYRKLKQIIENLLSTDGDIIQMSVDGHDSQSIASQFKCTEMEVEAILTKYNQKNITSAISIAASNLQNKKLIQELRSRYQYLFDPLINRCLNNSQNTFESKGKISKLIKNLLDKGSKYAEIIELHNEGYTLQDIGDKYGLTRERIRQIIKKYEGYYLECGSSDWCLKELEIMTEIQAQSIVKRLPSNRELNTHHPKLVGALRKNFFQQRGIW